MVRQFRLGSERLATNKLASYPMLFGEIRQPKTSYLIMPKMSSQNRAYMPIGFVDSSVIVSGSALVIPNATSYDYGVLQSKMHMAWMRTVCGRMKLIINTLQVLCITILFGQKTLAIRQKKLWRLPLRTLLI